VEYARHYSTARKAYPEGQTSRAQIIAIQALCKHVRGFDNFPIVHGYAFTHGRCPTIATF
jgi:hypothetical protein